jgi:hypothetical protein
MLVPLPLIVIESKSGVEEIDEHLRSSDRTDTHPRLNNPVLGHNLSAVKRVQTILDFNRIFWTKVRPGYAS